MPAKNKCFPVYVCSDKKGRPLIPLGKNKYTNMR